METLKHIGLLGLIIVLFIGVLKYEKRTIELEKRMENVEVVSDDNFQAIQKMNCQEMYGATACEEDFLIVPPYEDIENIIIGIIKEHEKFSSQGYRDGCLKKKNGTCVEYRYSIGYGTKEKTPGETISEEEASVRLSKHLKDHVFPYIPKNVTDKGVYIALADLGYNAGPRAIRECVNFDGTLNVEEYQKWTKANGKSNEGLERRRKGTLIYALSVMDM